ncbi:uncharacterized protein [Typha angustifolia]|uniref:uncharacterized protein n=1 Tax=Typha angustifolia TaxID=59011 RepID=UPI003C2C9B00
MAEPLRLQIEEIKTHPDRSLAYTTLLHLQRRSADNPSSIESLALLSPPLLGVLLDDIHHKDEEIAAISLKCLGFMLYHPSIVSSISEEMGGMALDSLVKLITTTCMKAICNLGVWCFSVQQFGSSIVELRVHSLVGAVVHALENPFGSLSTTYEATQAVMRLACQISKRMRDLSSIWVPPIYRRLLSTNKIERNVAERCLIKISSIILPSPSLLSEAALSDLKQKLLPCMAEMLHDHVQKVHVIKAWGWYISLLGSNALKNRDLVNKMLKIPEKTFTDHDPQVQIGSLAAWRHLADALILPGIANFENQVSSENMIQQTKFAPIATSTRNSDISDLLKKMKVIMVPLLGIMSRKCNIAVQYSCLNTWNYVLHKLDSLVNHRSVIEVAYVPILNAIFSSGPDEQNMCLWTSCLDILHEHVLSNIKEMALPKENLCDQVKRSTLAGSFVYGKDLQEFYPIKWLPWDISYLGFHLKMICRFINPEIMKATTSENRILALSAALKIFRSVLKVVHVEFNRSFTCENIQVSIKSIMKFAKEICEDLVLKQLTSQCDDLLCIGLQFVKAIREELEPSVLSSPSYEISLDINYISDLQLPAYIGYPKISVLGVRPIAYMNMVCPMVYTTVFYLSMLAQFTIKLSLRDPILQENLQFFSVNTIENFHSVVSFLYMLIRKPLDERLNCLTMWSIVAKGLKEQISCIFDSSTADYKVVYQFLCYPFLILLPPENTSASFNNQSSSKLLLASSQLESEMELVIEVYKSLHDYSSHGSTTTSVNDFMESLCQFLIGLLDENIDLFRDNLKCSLWEKSPRIVILSVLGEASIQILENSQVLYFSTTESKESDKGAADCRQFGPIKNRLELVRRFLELSLVPLKENPQAEHQITNRVFTSLVSFAEQLVLQKDILLLLEILSDPLCQWLSSCALLYGKMQQGIIYQLLSLWGQTLDCLQRSQPLIIFDSSLLMIQAPLLQTTLDHPHPPIADVTVAFWNATYGQKVNLQYPQCLITKLVKLSRTRKIDLRNNFHAYGAFSREEVEGLSERLTAPVMRKRTLGGNEFDESESKRASVNMSIGLGRKRLKLGKYIEKAQEHQDGCEHPPGSSSRIGSAYPLKGKEPRKPEHILEMLQRK